MKEEMLKFASDLINRDDVESIHYGGYDEWANGRILASVIKEKMENYIKYCDEYLKNNVENPTLWENKEFGKSLELSIKKSSTLDSELPTP